MLPSYGSRAVTVVITPQLATEEKRALIKMRFNCDNILRPEEAIGLEFETVILWHPFSGAPGIKSLVNKTHGEPLSLEQWNAFNGLYVALKRAQQRVFIFEEEQERWQKLSCELLGDTVCHNQLDDKQNLKTTAAEKENVLWQAQRDYHLQQGNYDIDERIMGDMLRMGNDEIQKLLREMQPFAQAASSSTATSLNCSL